MPKLIAAGPHDYEKPRAGGMPSGLPTLRAPWRTGSEHAPSEYRRISSAARTLLPTMSSATMGGSSHSRCVLHPPPRGTPFVRSTWRIWWRRSIVSEKPLEKTHDHFAAVGRVAMLGAHAVASTVTCPVSCVREGIDHTIDWFMGSSIDKAPR